MSSKRKRTLNNPSDAYQLAKGIVAAARIVTQDKMPRDHNFEMAWALLTAAGKVQSKE